MHEQSQMRPASADLAPAAAPAPPSPSPPNSAPTRPAHPGTVLAVLCAAAFMASLDLFVVNVAFTAIGRDFRGSPLSDLSWVLNAYAIGYAALLVPLGRLADRFGRKAGFLAGLGLFTAASAACAASPNLWFLVVCRVLQAAGAAALTPTSLGLLIASTEPRHRARAVRIWASSGAVASALGPVVGGLLVEASWQWVFLINVPVGLLALAAAVRLVPDSRDPAAGRLPDLWGALVLAVSIGALTLALVKGPDWGWGTAGTLAGFAVAAVGLAGFVLRILRHPAPVVEPGLLRVRAFAWSNATSLLFSTAFGAGLLSVILWMQNVWHYSALRTGLAVAPGPMMVPLFAAVAQRLARRVPVGLIATAGSLLFGLGFVIDLASIGTTPAYAADLLPGWLVGGAGVGLALPTILSSATADLPPSRAATGSAVVNMSRQIGTVLGVSMLVAVLGTPASPGAAHTVFVHGWWAIAAVAAFAAVCAVGMTPPAQSP
ncbi:MAG TPA: MFS transporter [Actinocrinis sp.]|uniref:MFS transporter n=1 Tax=Actinocrinis sp. TaxID=1920516 RepID=UPI002DDCA5FD|nr:MFS transporter [Actinocrinis sp.]HEV3171553.1 MFS transporter [Actinocrinis sp.]